MAELAIPLVALGAAYVMCNQDKKESYENMGKPVNSLPNTDIPAKNYPTLAPVSAQNVERYPNANAATDKYFNDQVYEKEANNLDQFGDKRNFPPNVSLTGDPIDKSNFQHNNMVPFFGAKIKGRTVNASTSESILDNMSGSGSQNFRKQEVAPLFAPQEDMNYANGAPNNSEFFLSRVMPSSKMANVKPWEEQHVGPGLDQGYGVKGSNGFNSGMEARDKWVDRNVDQLRVETNPKLTFGLANHEGPAYSYVKNPASAETQGKVEKYHPDTFYINTPDRWLTTTGLEKGQTSRAIEVDKDVNRPSTNMEYFGANSNPEGNATYTPANHEQPRRPCLKANPVLNSHAPQQNSVTEADYGMKSHKALPNNRCGTQDPGFGFVGGAIKSVVAPLLDILRPSRKENVIGNLRPCGQAGSLVSANVVYNPADRLPTTTRETTEGLLDFNHLNVENQSNAAYTVSKQQSIENQRDTTNCSYLGNAAASAHTGNTVYNAAYNQHNNVNKSYKSRTSQGNMGLFTGEQNVCLNRDDADRENNRMWVKNAGPATIPSTDTYGKINMPQYYNECQGCDRIEPEILDAFKKNPYTQSLSSY